MRISMDIKLGRLWLVKTSGSWLKFLIEASYLAAILIVPLWFAYLFPTYNIFEFNKLVIFKVLFWLLFFLTVWRLVFLRDCSWPGLKRIFYKYWLWPLFFVAGLGVGIYFSDNPGQSFYGTMERQAGWQSYFYYFFWFILVSFDLFMADNSRESSYSRQRKVKRILLAIVIAATISSVYGLLQILGFDFIYWPESAFLTNRISSTLGQPNFLASWLLLAIPVAIYLSGSTRRFLARFFFGLAALIQSVCFFWTGSRGGLIALILIGIIYAVYIFLRAPWRRQQKIWLALGFIVVALSLLLAVNRLWPGRISSIADLNSGSVAARVNFYLGAADAIKTRPLLGYGLESGNDVFISYYEPDWAVYGDVGQSADRAHNILLDILLNGGFFGLVLFSLFYYFFFYLVRGNVCADKQSGLSLSLGLGAAAYLLSLLFSFTVVSGEIYFWLYLALLAALNYQDKGVSGRPGQYQLPKIVITLLILAATFLTAWQIIRAWGALRADYYYNQAYYLLAAKDYPAALNKYGLAQSQPINNISRYSYATAWSEKLSEAYPVMPAEIRSEAAASLAEAADFLPDSGYRHFLAKAKIYRSLGYYEAAGSYIDRIIALSPYWPLAYIEQGKLFSGQERFPEAALAYHLALLNLPSIADNRLNEQHLGVIRQYQYLIYYQIGTIYEKIANYSVAEKYYKLAYGSFPSDFTLLKKMADMEYRRGNLQMALFYTEHGLARNPGDYKWLVALASLYYEAGLKEQALEYLAGAAALAPDNQEIVELRAAYSREPSPR